MGTLPNLLQEIETSNEPFYKSGLLWTVAKYAKLITQDQTNDQQLLKQFLKSILVSIQDPNLRVQESSCHALSKLIDTSSYVLSNYLNDVLIVIS